MCCSVPPRVHSSRRRPLEGAVRSCMALGGALSWRGFCAEDTTCLKRQCHCDASGLHLCTLSLFFRRSDALCSAVGNWQPSCFAGYRHTGPPLLLLSLLFFACVPACPSRGCWGCAHWWITGIRTFKKEKKEKAIGSLNTSCSDPLCVRVWVWDESVFAAEDDLAPPQSEENQIWLSGCDS